MKKRVFLSLLVFNLFPASFVLAEESSSSEEDSEYTVNSSDEASSEIRLSLGGSLDVNQIQQIQTLFGASSEDVSNAVITDGELLNKYLQDGSDESTDILSSSKVEFRSTGYGINVTILTPDNITQVSESMYQNAAIAAGATNADIQIASVVPVTGEGALAGVYEVFSQSGIELDSEDIQNAERQLKIEQILSEESNLNSSQISQLITTINLNIVNELEKKEDLSEADIQKIIDDVLMENGFDLTEHAKELILEHGKSFSQSDVSRDPETKKALENTLEAYASLEEAYSNIFDVGYGEFKIDELRIIPVGAENNHDDTPALAIYYTFSLDEDAYSRSAGQAWTDSVSVTQDNDPNVINDLFAKRASYYEEEYTHTSYSDIKPGGSVKAMESYRLEDTETPITLEFYNNAWDQTQKPLGDLTIDLNLITQ